MRFSLRFFLVVTSCISVLVMFVSWIAINRFTDTTVYHFEAPNGKVVLITRRPTTDWMVPDNYEISIGLSGSPIALASFPHIGVWGRKLQFETVFQEDLVVVTAKNEPYINVAVDLETNEIAIEHLDHKKFKRLEENNGTSKEISEGRERG